MKGACSSPLYFLSQECWRHSYIQCCPKMMERTALLAIYCLLMPISASPLYPSLKFGQRATSILLSSTVEHPLQLPNTDYSSSQTRESMFRAGRHADAIFTNSYRKVLGQISARKLLQSVMGRTQSSTLRNGSQIFKRHPSNSNSVPPRKRRGNRTLIGSGISGSHGLEGSSHFSSLHSYKHRTSTDLHCPTQIERLFFCMHFKDLC
ncbi:somatoliberin isoform X2 [Engraulis encrasicolus]|uniref:somatoliberin isoform X2 n=1 Tax=Engraulis encrasicolus TaxID=184585 RepID=UPI002FD44035